MSKILVINGNLHGHFNPTLPLVTELVNRDNEVWYYCSSLFKDKLLAAGVNFISSDDLEYFYKNYRPTGNHPFYSILEYMVNYYQVMLPSLMEKIQGKSFDLVICDSILGASYFIKQIMKIPVISSNSSFAMNQLPVPEYMLSNGYSPQLDEFYKVLYHVCQEWNTSIPSVQEFFLNKGDINIVYTSKEFNPGGDLFDDSYHFVGPSIDKRQDITDFPFDKMKHQKVVYISLGTINTNFQEFYQKCMDSLENTDISVIMSVGKKINISSFNRIPDNFIIKNYVPQLEILKRCNIFISHGGFNSVSEALYYGVPVIVIPLANDQFMTAQHIEKIGAGKTLKMNNITTVDIRNTVYDIMADKQYYENCSQIRDSFHNAGGYKKAADYIQHFLQERVAMQ